MTDLNDARFQEQAIAQWQDWRRYLDLNLRLAECRLCGSADIAVFEVVDEAADSERAIKAQLAAIGADVLALFDREVEARRQQVHAQMDAERRASGDTRARPLDADEVERRALLELRDEAEGTHTNGIGVVPMADGWYDVDADKLREVPSESSYRLASTRKLPAPKIALLVAVALAGLLAIWWTRPNNTEAAGVDNSSSVLVNDQSVDVWTPRAITLTGEQPVTWLIGGDAGDATAQWQRGAWPLTICIPKTELSGLQTVRVASENYAPERVYRVGENAPELADLVIRSCSGKGEQWYGTFEHAEVSQPLAVGAAAQLRGNRSVTLRSLGVVGPGQDTTLPEGRAQVIATVDGSGVDWSQLSVVLRWPDGQDVLPSASEPRDDGVTFRYLVPLFDTPVEQAQFQIAESATGTVMSWEAPLAPPLTRVETIRQALADVEVAAERDETGALRVTLRLSNAGGEALALDERDIVVTQDTRQVQLPTLEALRTPLAARETRTVELVMNLPGGQTITLTVGSFAFQITT